jgi:hypothetical protein
MTPKPSSLEFVTIAEARDLGYDTCQIKYDGIASRHVIENGRVSCYTLFDNQLTHSYDCPRLVQATMLADYFYGPRHVDRKEWFGKVMVHDCTHIENNGVMYKLNQYPYKERYAIARSIVEQLKEQEYLLIKNYPIKLAEQVWDQEVIPHRWKGLIFRKSLSADAPVLCQRYYPEVVGEPQAVREMMRR